MAEYKTGLQVNYGFGLSFQASGKAPIIAKEIWATLADAQAYVDSETDTATAGLKLVVIKDPIDTNNGVYWVKSAAGEDGNTKGELVKVGNITADEIEELRNKINANTTAISTLNGDGAGSVKKTATDIADAKVTAAKDELIGADDTVEDTIKYAEKLANEAQATADTAKATADTAVQTVTTSDKYLSVTRADGSNDVTIASDGIDAAIKTAADAVKVSVKGGGYITGTVDAAGRAITLGSNTHAVSTATADANGLATAADVKEYVDDKVTDAITAATPATDTKSAGTDVKVSVTTTAGTVSNVTVDASTLKTAVLGTDTDTADKNTVYGAKAAAKAADDKAAAARTYAEGVLGKSTDASTANTVYGAQKAAAEAKSAADAAKSAADAVKVTATGDTYVSANVDEATGRAITVAATESTKASLAKANTALQEVTGANAINVTGKSKISLVTSDKGNVKFTNDADGLSADVTIPAAKVDGVAAADNILALGADKLISATVALSYEEDETDKKKYICLKGKGGANLGKIDASDFIKDGMVDSVAYNEETHELTITFNTGAGKDPIVVNLTSLVDTYKAGTGLTLGTDGTFAVDTTVIATKASVDTLKTSVDANTKSIGTAKTDSAAATGLYKVIDDKVAAEVTARNNAISTAIGKLDYTDTAAAGQFVTKVDEADGKITVTRAALEATDIPTLAVDKIDGLQAALDAKATPADIDSKINALDVVGNESTAVNGVSVTVDQTDGKVAKPVVTIVTGSVDASNNNLVTGGTVYAAVEAAKAVASTELTTALTWGTIE